MKLNPKKSILLFAFLTMYFSNSFAQSNIAKLLNFYGQHEDAIRNYEGENYSFIAGIASYNGNWYGESVENGESLNGLVVSLPLLNGESDVLLYFDAKKNIINRIGTKLTHDQAELFIKNELANLKLSIVKEIKEKDCQKIIYSNDKFVFGLSKYIYSEDEYDLEVYSIKELNIALRNGDISAP